MSGLYSAWVICRAALVGAALAGCAAPPGAAERIDRSEYHGFADPLPVTISGYTGDAMEPFITKDGRYLLFNNRNDPSINTDLYYAARIDDQTFKFLGPLPDVNSPALDAVPSLDNRGHLFFISTRSYGETLSTVYSGRFEGTAVGDVAIVAGISQHRPGRVNFDAEISADGETLWFDDGQFSARGELRMASIAVASRQGNSFVRRADSTAVLAAVNSSGLNYAPCISVDGLELFFTRVDAVTTGHAPAIYRATRPEQTAVFDPPQLVEAATGFVEAPSLSADGHLLYFHKRVDGKFVVYTVRR